MGDRTAEAGEFDVAGYMTSTIDNAIQADARVRTSPVAVVSTLVSLACVYAEKCGVNVLSVLTIFIPRKEPDEELAVAAVRRAYAKSRAAVAAEAARN